jgi:hypothetical protein
MKTIDVKILNRALVSPGRLSRSDNDFIQGIDAKRSLNPFVRLNFYERQRLNRIGRVFDIYPESERGDSLPIASAGLPDDLQNRERELAQSLSKRGKQ